MLDNLLNSLIREGTLTVLRPSASPMTFGSGYPRITMRLHDRLAVAQLCLDPDLALGELYMDGRLTIEDGDIADLLGFLMHNVAVSGTHGIQRLLRSVRHVTRALSQFNPAGRSKAHVAHHYDLSDALYDTFLDADKQYSCAYFANSGDTLEAAQREKKRRIAAKLYLWREGLTVLDIGCGWGGLALDLAMEHQADVTGVTLSERQIAVARKRAASTGLSKQCRFDLVDYRAIEGQFDRIVSVGMFEHVGAPYYNRFFAKVRDLLRPDGVMLLHTIGYAYGPGATNAWIAKYIFPGGYAPALSEILPAIEKSGLIVTDIEVLRLHYAETLKAWRARFQAQRAAVRDLYDERFCRMWEFYLAGSEMAFRHDGDVVYQIQIAKQTDALPITRDYMSTQVRPQLRAMGRSA